MTKKETARLIAEEFEYHGFKQTAKWIIFSLENPDSPLLDDFKDIINTFRSEFGQYSVGPIDDPKYNRECFDICMKTIFKGVKNGNEKLKNLITKLGPLFERIIENNESMDSMIDGIKELELYERFHRHCRFYQMLWEGDYRFVRKTLLAIDRLNNNQELEISETLTIMAQGVKIESASAFDEVIPERLKGREHRHLRNAIAHYSLRFLKEEGKMEFWDIEPNTQRYSWGPKKYSLKEFQNYLAEVDIFWEASGFALMLLMVTSDLRYKRKKS